jgi:hypothetical protein
VGFPEQVHGPHAHVLDQPPDVGGSAASLGVAGVDALVTRLPGTPIAVLVADCMPVLLGDPVNRVVGAAHAGRRGLAQGVLQATVTAMQSLGAEPAVTTAVIGPAICGRCYEVPAQMQAEVEASILGTASRTRQGTPTAGTDGRPDGSPGWSCWIAMAEQPTAEPAGADRLDELRANLADVEERIAAACRAAGRSRTELTLIAVTKTFPAEDVRGLAEIGLIDVGENRDQEAAPKHAECADLGLRWHFVGQLQRNKARSVAEYADVVHSIDRPALVESLSRAAESAGRTVTGLVQVDLDPATQANRAGADPVEVRDLADRVAAAPGLLLGGVMAVAPLGADPGAAFARLAAVAEQVRAAHPQALVVSAGMSGDLESAVANGATHLRIGTALLGRRSVPLG